MKQKINSPLICSYTISAGSSDWINEIKQTNRQTVVTAKLQVFSRKLNSPHFTTAVSGFSCPWHIRRNTTFCIQFTTLQQSTVLYRYHYWQHSTVKLFWTLNSAVWWGRELKVIQTVYVITVKAVCWNYKFILFCNINIISSPYNYTAFQHK